MRTLQHISRIIDDHQLHFHRLAPAADNHEMMAGGYAISESIFAGETASPGA